MPTNLPSEYFVMYYNIFITTIYIISKAIKVISGMNINMDWDKVGKRTLEHPKK